MCHACYCVQRFLSRCTQLLFIRRVVLGIILFNHKTTYCPDNVFMLKFYTVWFSVVLHFIKRAAYKCLTIHAMFITCATTIPANRTLSSNITKPRFPISDVLVAKLFWNFIHRKAFSLQNFQMIWKLKWVLWINKNLRDLISWRVLGINYCNRPIIR